MRPIPFMLLILACLFFNEGIAQCDQKIDYSVKKSGAGYSLELRSDQTLTDVKAKLYDLVTGKVVQDKKVASMGTVVFSNIPPSRYSVIITSKECSKTKSVGGIIGISIGSPTKD